MEAEGIPFKSSGGGPRWGDIAPAYELVDAPVQETPQAADKGAALGVLH